MTIEVEEPAMFSDDVMCAMAVCDPCSAQHDVAVRGRIAKFHKAIEREESEPVQKSYRKPYSD